MRRIIIGLALLVALVIPATAQANVSMPKGYITTVKFSLTTKGAPPFALSTPYTGVVCQWQTGTLRRRINCSGTMMIGFPLQPVSERLLVVRPTKCSLRLTGRLIGPFTEGTLTLPAGYLIYSQTVKHAFC